MVYFISLKDGQLFSYKTWCYAIIDNLTNKKIIDVTQEFVVSEDADKKLLIFTIEQSTYRWIDNEISEKIIIFSLKRLSALRCDLKLSSVFTKISE